MSISMLFLKFPLDASCMVSLNKQLPPGAALADRAATIRNGIAR